MEKKLPATDEFGKHEVLDRTYVLMDTFALKVVEHEVVTQDAELQVAADKVFVALWEMYQLCGRKFLNGQ